MALVVEMLETSGNARSVAAPSSDLVYSRGHGHAPTPRTFTVVDDFRLPEAISYLIMRESDGYSLSVRPYNNSVGGLIWRIHEHPTDAYGMARRLLGMGETYVAMWEQLRDAVAADARFKLTRGLSAVNIAIPDNTITTYIDAVESGDGWVVRVLGSDYRQAMTARTAGEAVSIAGRAIDDATRIDEAGDAAYPFQRVRRTGIALLTSRIRYEFTGAGATYRVEFSRTRLHPGRAYEASLSSSVNGGLGDGRARDAARVLGTAVAVVVDFVGTEGPDAVLFDSLSDGLDSVYVKGLPVMTAALAGAGYTVEVSGERSFVVRPIG